MSLKTTITDDVFEKTTSFLSGTITDPATDAGFKPTTLVGTLYCVENGTIINSRNATNYMDTNGATVSSGGVLSLELTPDDNQIIGARTGKTAETHRMLLVWTWNGGARIGRHEFEWDVQENLKVS
jgi:hypothetical protein